MFYAYLASFHTLTFAQVFGASGSLFPVKAYSNAGVR